MKEKLINELIESYNKSDICSCITKLFMLVLFYNSDIKDFKSYDHSLKHLLFNSNFIRNPLGAKYTKSDYEKTIKIVFDTIEMCKATNNSNIDTTGVLQKELIINKQIIADLIDIVIYTECFYKMNIINSKRIDDNKFSNLPFVEQLFSIVLFFQDQNRLLTKNYPDYVESDYYTGMELSISNCDVDYNDNQKTSVLDSNELSLESMDVLIRYLFYKNGKKIEEEIIDIDYSIIKPYENVDFEKIQYTAIQRYLLCQVEEGIRYGYYKFGYKFTTQDQLQAYAFSFEDEVKNKARFYGSIRREHQFRQLYVLTTKNPYLMEQLNKGYEEVSILANELISIQKDNIKTFDFELFHPNKNSYLHAENIAKIKEQISISLIKEYYLDCCVAGVEIKDLFSVYSFLFTLSKILFFASNKLIDENEVETYTREISIIKISYLETELSRIHGFESEYSAKLIDRFVFHDKNNKYDDIFSQPLIKISKSQVLLSEALINQLNLDRIIERQFIKYDKNMSDIGKIFESEFIKALLSGYKDSFMDSNKHAIPNLEVNINHIQYKAFDGKDIEFDVVCKLEDYLILIELKSIMTSYDLSELEKRKKNIRYAIEQLKRRCDSIQYDWETFKNQASISLPENAIDKKNIILIACSDAYDFTPLKIDDVYITDDSSILKYFTNPYIESFADNYQGEVKHCKKSLWEKGYPTVRELKKYLMRPISVSPFIKSIKKHTIPLPIFDENDYAICCETFQLTKDPIITTFRSMNKKNRYKKKKHKKKKK